MFTAINRVTFAKTQVGDINDLTPPDQWIVNPVYSDPVRAELVNPKFWEYPGGSNVRIPTEEELDTNPSLVAVAKAERIAKLSQDCALDIMSGFTSDALGALHIYDSEEVDQLNLIGSVSTTAPTPDAPTGYTIYYAVRNVETQIKSYELHTHFQLRQVLADGAQVKLFKLQKFAVKRAIVEMQSTVSGVEAITWESTP